MVPRPYERPWKKEDCAISSCMVRGILTTYNPDSPYISLADWDGTPCYDCGYVMDDESVYYCSHCDNAVCDECSRVCTDCGEIVCGNCASQCEICDRSLCPKCAKTKCSECESICCESCITDGLCPDCQKEMEKEDEEQQTETMDETPDTDGSETTVVGGRLAGPRVCADGARPCGSARRRGPSSCTSGTNPPMKWAASASRAPDDLAVHTGVHHSQAGSDVRQRQVRR